MHTEDKPFEMEKTFGLGVLLKLIKNPLKLIAMNTFMKNYYGRLSVKGIIE